MTKKEMITVAMLSVLALPLGVRAQNLNWDQGVNVKAMVAGFKKEAVASAKAQAVQVSGPVSKTPFEQLEALWASKNAVAPSLDELKGVHKGKCYWDAGSNIDPNDGSVQIGVDASITGTLIDHTPPIDTTLDLKYVDATGSYEMHVIQSKQGYITVLYNHWECSDYIYHEFKIAKVGSNLVAKSKSFFIVADGSTEEDRFNCVFPLSGAK